MRALRVTLAALLVSSLAGIACGPPDGGGGKVVQEDAGPIDSTGGDVLTCPETKVACSGECIAPTNAATCGGTCVNTKTNIQHCGGCGNACGSGGLYCGGGECKCIEQNLDNCDGKCLNLQTDEQNCGSCGNACRGGERCEQGSCETLDKVEKAVQETNKVRSTETECARPNGSIESMGPSGRVEPNAELHKAAQSYAETMAENTFMEHTYPPPGCNPNADQGCHDFVWRIEQTNYQNQPLGENIANGQSTAAGVVEDWKNSHEGHCQNMMNDRANEIGIGVARSSKNNRLYWVQLFGRKNP